MSPLRYTVIMMIICDILSQCVLLPCGQEAARIFSLFRVPSKLFFHSSVDFCVYTHVTVVYRNEVRI